MPRHAGDFQIIKRRDRDGIYYARFRNESGDLLPWTSTGLTSRTAARSWAAKQVRAGTATSNRVLTFARYAEKWWTPEHEYIRGKLARGRHISRSYCDNQRRNLEKYILPAFGSKRLASIKTGSIETWCLSLGDAYGIGPVAVNHVLRCLKTMLAEARRLGLISANPAADVAPLQEAKKQRQVLTLAEIARLFDEATIGTAWSGDERAYTGALIGASCGLRLGEIQGLTVGSVRDGYLVVSHAWERRYGLKPPKTGAVRQVPLPGRTARHLRGLMEASPYQLAGDLVFYGSDRAHAVDNKRFANGLNRALAEIGIGETEREARGLTFHGLRHTFASIMRGKVPDHVLAAMTGHKTPRMVDHYSHPGADELASFAQVQEAILQ